jgi:hypothetical protein
MYIMCIGSGAVKVSGCHPVILGPEPVRFIIGPPKGKNGEDLCKLLSALYLFVLQRLLF